MSSSATASAGLLQSCWLRLLRHDYLLKVTRDRMFLRCQTCGVETPGWELTAAPPRLRYAGHPRRHIGCATSGRGSVRRA